MACETCVTPFCQEDPRLKEQEGVSIEGIVYICSYFKCFYLVIRTVIPLCMCNDVISRHPFLKSTIDVTVRHGWQ